MSRPAIHQEVLSEALTEAIDGGRVVAAVFTTFSFDPGFFELHILPLLFDYSFSQVEKVRRIQLEDQLRTAGEVAVYYDRTALAQDALPAQLDFRRIDVRRATGVFHPKVVLALVEDDLEEDEEQAAALPRPRRLIAGALSANLTRAGWWENVETGHFEVIHEIDVDDTPCPFRRDLLGLVKQIRAAAAPDEDHGALDRIHEFLRAQTATKTYKTHRAGGRYRTRLYCGQKPLPAWLRELRLGREEWNLEVISPFFDRRDAETLGRLIDAIGPRETRIYLPVDQDGVAQVAPELYDAVPDLARWSRMPQSVLHGGRTKLDPKRTPRRVHAKVYRLWSRDAGEVVLTGSVNLTAAAHSAGNAGNLEAAFLVDVSDAPGRRTWWLEPLEKPPADFVEVPPSEADGAEPVCLDISFRYDWSRHALEYRLDDQSDGALEIQESAGRSLFTITNPCAGEWTDCGSLAADSVRDLLTSTSFLRVVHPKGSWRVLVREEGMSHRPSLLMSLTPEEILMYWSMLSPDLQAAFIEQKLAAEGGLEGLKPFDRRIDPARRTVFDRFAGIYHAFKQLWRFVDEALWEQRDKAARARLFGAKYDSLPEFLRKSLDRNDTDPVIRYVVFLCARQTIDRVCNAHPDFWAETDAAERRRLEELLARLPELRASLRLYVSDGRDFLAWYEGMFLGEIEQPEEVGA